MASERCNYDTGGKEVGRKNLCFRSSWVTIGIRSPRKSHHLQVTWRQDLEEIGEQGSVGERLFSRGEGTLPY